MLFCLAWHTTSLQRGNADLDVLARIEHELTSTSAETHTQVDAMKDMREAERSLRGNSLQMRREILNRCGARPSLKRAHTALRQLTTDNQWAKQAKTLHAVGSGA